MSNTWNGTGWTVRAVGCADRHFGEFLNALAYCAKLPVPSTIQRYSYVHPTRRYRGGLYHYTATSASEQLKRLRSGEAFGDSLFDLGVALARQAAAGCSRRVS